MKAKAKDLSWTIDYTLSGSITVKASSAEEAQDKFDAMLSNGIPRDIQANGEWSNAKPYRDYDEDGPGA